MSKILRVLSKIKNVFTIKTEDVSLFFEESNFGYNKLYDNHKGLYNLIRSYLLDYAQKWDDEEHKKKELKEILSFVGIPSEVPKKRKMKLLKRQFKQELAKIDCSLVKEESDYKVTMVKIANVLLKYRLIKK